MACAPNLDWSGVPLRRLLAGRVPAALTPVVVENEANLAALGELWFGDGGGLGDYVHISAEVGIGAGIVVAGELFRGAHGHAGELGHTTLEPDGPACACGGRGCLELYAGQEAILRRAGLDPAASTSTGRADGPVGTLVARLAAGDPRALEASRWPGAASGWRRPRWSSCSTRTRWSWAGSTPCSPPGCGSRSSGPWWPASP